MTFLRSSRLPVLAGVLLLMGFAATAFGAVRFDVVPSPTEVINTGRSEVTGSVKLIVRGTGNLTGSSAGGNAQIGFIYTSPTMLIDNTTSSGIRLFYSSGFATAVPSIVSVENRDINGRCTGFITINLQAGAAPVEGDFISLEGVRGRIDLSLALTPGTDLYVDLQSINDPTASNFTPDRVRVAKSLDGMNVEIKKDSLLLCFPTLGKAPGDPELKYYIKITEGFQRAFVDLDAADDASVANDRVDTGKNLLGAPTNSTRFAVWMEQIPASVDKIEWQGAVADSSSSATGAKLVLFGDPTYDKTAGTALAYYEYQTLDQVNVSDIAVEVFKLQPKIILKAGSTATGTVMAGVSLAPYAESLSACAAPAAAASDGTVRKRPRFMQMWESDDVATNNPPDDPFKPYAQIVRCNCYLLFTYVTADPTFTTGIVIANTTGDKEVFGDFEAPDQLGKITFYFYDKAQGYVGSTTTTSDTNPGRSFVALSHQILPAGVTSFAGYIIAKAEFQFCHGVAYIADQAFAATAHGYPALVIPDPSIKNAGGKRSATDSGDIASSLPAGEGLNN